MSARPRLVVPAPPDATAVGLTLDPVTMADVPAITAYCQDPVIREWTPVPAPYGPRDAADFVVSADRGWAEGATVTWAVRERTTLVGTIGLELQPVRSAEVGYLLAPSARGRGLMTRVLRTVVAHAFDPDGLGLDRIFWQAFVGNVASLRVAEAAGFTVEGTVRGHAVQRGRRRDAWVGTLLRSDPGAQDAADAAS